MYCVNCGVKLADTEKICPLCKTVAFHPDIERRNAEDLYPKDKYPSNYIASKAPQIVITVLFLMPMLIVLLCDLQISGRVSWSGYVIGALLVSYICLILPIWFQKPNPVIFVPCGFGSVILYLLYINLVTGNHWFLSFAFPVAGGIGLIVTALVTLLRYIPRGKLYIVGGSFIAMGVFMLLVEYLMNLTFQISHFIGWSLYPLVVLGLFGGMLIFLAINRTARETMERKFFI